MKEALETWEVPLFEKVLPRHLQIIFEINHRFLKTVAQKWPNDEDKLRRMSMIEESDPKKIRMAHLAICGSHSVNGVANLHTKLLRKDLFPDFDRLWPDKFNNKTNGITQRRWLLNANPELAGLIRLRIGDDWIIDAEKLRELETFCEDEMFKESFRDIKRKNKLRLSEFIREATRVKVDPDSIFDVHIKRIHEYKRQLLNVLHIVNEYFRIKRDGKRILCPRTYIFAGKAAPGYRKAKQIIKLIHGVAETINNDSSVSDKMKVVFIPDYRVSLAEMIIPATDVSEQISTAGMEASGTGNMKFAMNGALTIGTMDGANIEIREEVGKDNIFIFGLTAEEIEEKKNSKGYDPSQYYHSDSRIKRVMDAFADDTFSPDTPGLFRWIYDDLLSEQDKYFHLADFDSYLRAHDKIEECYNDPGLWIQKAIKNVARTGKFSSDRAIRAYAKQIWNIKPVA
jgi:starch phosphorylase